LTTVRRLAWRRIGRKAAALGSAYLLDELVGQGAMGQVYRARRRDDEETTLAVKVLRPELTADAEVVARFLQERAILTGLDHPNLVRVRDLVAEGETLAIVMDLVSGPDLRQHLRQAGGTLAPSDAVEVLAQVLDGLAAVHAAGVVHRDLKPENVLVDRSDPGAPRMRLSDFGVARIACGPTLTKITGPIGTPEYMAPEVAEADDATPAADLYAAGILLYELLAGRTPFAGGYPAAVLRRHLDEEPAPITGVPEDLWRVVAELLAKDPSARPPNAAAVAARLRSLAPTLSGLAAAPVDDDERTETVWASRPRPRPAALPRRRRRRVRVALAGTTALVVLAVGVGFGVTRPTRHGPTAPVSFAFAPAVYSGGLVVTRRWTLAGSGASRLQARLHLTNASTATIDDYFDEVIPKDLARSSDEVTFHPAPDRVVERDPVVRYELDHLAPGHDLEVAYDIAVAPLGKTLARLKRWARSQGAAQAAYARRVTASAPQAALVLAHLDLTPTSVPLTVGQTYQLSPAGTMSDASPAPPVVLAGLAWTSSDAAVVAVSDGRLVANGPGTATVTAQAGALHASATVSVVAANQQVLGSTHTLPASSYTPPVAVTAGPPTPGPAPTQAPSTTPAPTQPPYKVCPNGSTVLASAACPTASSGPTSTSTTSTTTSTTSTTTTTATTTTTTVVPPPPPPPSPSITASKGGAYGCGDCFTLNIQVHNFPTGTYTYYCHDNSGTGGSDSMFYSHAVTVTDPNQSTWPGVFCWDDHPYVAYLVMNNVRSNSVQF
jgi:Protein kinase domain/Bacterial Ig-like domain (group 2)